MKQNIIINRLISGAGLRILLLILNVIISFYMMPFLIHSLGDRMYGFWSLVGTFMGYYGFLDLGLSSAVSRYVSKAYGRTDYDEMNTIINTSLILFSILGLFIIVLSLIAVLICPWFFSNHRELLLFQKVLIVLSMDLALGFPMRAFSGVLRAKIRYDLTVYVQLLKLIIRSILVFLFVKTGYGLFSIAVITFSVNFVGYLLQFYFTKKEFPSMLISLGLFKRTRLKKLFNYSKYTFLTQISDFLRLKIDSFIIAGFLNVDLVTGYVIATRLLEYFVQIVTNSIGLLSPVISQLEGKGDFNAIREWFLKATKISTSLSVFIGASIIIYGKVFIERWMGAAYEYSYVILLILTGGFICALSQNPCIGLLYGISKHKYYAIANTCEGILNLSLSIILVKKFGLNGVALGTFIPMVFFKVLIQPLYVCSVTKISIPEYIITILKSLLITGIPLVIFYYVIQDYLNATYITIFTFAILQSLVILPILFVFILTSREKKILLNIFKKQM